PLADAEATLEQAHLTPGTPSQAPSDTCEQGQVIGQDPQAFTKVERDSTVILTVASGPTPITLGDYTCQVFNSVKNKLEHEGLVVQIGTDVLPLLPQCPNTNRVVQQSPAPGSQVQQGDTVTLWT